MLMNIISTFMLAKNESETFYIFGYPYEQTISNPCPSLKFFLPINILRQ